MIRVTKVIQVFILWWLEKVSKAKGERVVETHWLPQSEDPCCLNEYVCYPTMLMVQVFFPFLLRPLVRPFAFDDVPHSLFRTLLEGLSSSDKGPLIDPFFEHPIIFLSTFPYNLPNHTQVVVIIQCLYIYNFQIAPKPNTINISL